MNRRVQDLVVEPRSSVDTQSKERWRGTEHLEPHGHHGGERRGGRLDMGSHEGLLGGAMLESNLKENRF